MSEERISEEELYNLVLSLPKEDAVKEIDCALNGEWQNGHDWGSL